MRWVGLGVLALVAVPRVISKEGHLARTQTEPAGVIQVEVLQLEWTNRHLRGLRWRAIRVSLTGHQFRRDLSLENRFERRIRPVVELLRHDHPSDQMLNQGLRYRSIHVVVGHLIADAIRAPAERQLAEVARADDEGAVIVRQPKQM